MRGDETVDMKILNTIAEREGTDVLDDRTPLYDVIDPDALDSLFRAGSESNGSVQFTYDGYRVVVDSSGAVDVSSRAEVRADARATDVSKAD